MKINKKGQKVKDTLPEHYAIFCYWRNKFITKDGLVISRYRSGSIPAVEDWAEPMCWACGAPIPASETSFRAALHVCRMENGEVDLAKLYADKRITSKYDRAHILPESLGGKPEVSNLFLLCRSCHWESPDTTNRSYFFRWVFNKRKNSVIDGKRDILPEVINELKARKYTEEEINLMLEKIPEDGGYEAIRQFLTKRVSMHFNTMSDSSFIGGAADFIEQYDPYLS